MNTEGGLIYYGTGLLTGGFKFFYAGSEALVKVLA